MGHTVQQKCCEGTFWLYIMVIVGLLLFSGLMSGLTLGLMSLGLVDLEVIKKSGKPADRKHAERIVPVVKKQHLLLVTLLVGNAMAMEALPLFLDSLVDTWVAIALSVTLLLMFGEILPQALCSRYGLAVGAAMAPVVRVLLFVMFPIAWPVSKLLDYLLGAKHEGLFGRAELKTLVDMHCHEAGNGGELTHNETRIIGGALELAGKTAGYVMTPIASTFSIDARQKLDDKRISDILSAGYSRIPVYSGKPNNIIGLILAKSLMKSILDHRSRPLPITEVAIRKIPFVSEDTPLYEVLHELQEAQTHMAAVLQAKPAEKVVDVDVQSKECEYEKTGAAPMASIDLLPSPKTKPAATHFVSMREERNVVGIITWESILEELLQERILDESDSKQAEVIDGDLNKLCVQEPPLPPNPASSNRPPPLPPHLVQQRSEQPPKTSSYSGPIYMFPMQQHQSPGASLQPLSIPSREDTTFSPGGSEATSPDHAMAGLGRSVDRMQSFNTQGPARNIIISPLPWSRSSSLSCSSAPTTPLSTFTSRVILHGQESPRPISRVLAAHRILLSKDKASPDVANVVDKKKVNNAIDVDS